MPPLTRHPPAGLVTSLRDAERRELMRTSVATLLQKGAIREVPPAEPLFFSRVFLVPKKNGKMRLVIDLSALNKWLQCPSFRMDHAQVVRDALEPDMWATSIDLSDAYLHIPIHQTSWPYLVFQVGSRRYQFLVLPFGLSTAPRVFSEVMMPLKRWGRALGILLFQYLDDWLQLHFSRTVLDQQTQRLIRKCASLGLLVNLEKSETAPLQQIVFLAICSIFRWGLSSRPGSAFWLFAARSRQQHATRPRRSSTCAP